MKYRLLDEETLGHMVDFLDTIQLEAAKGEHEKDLDKINMCSYLISEIINANEATEIDDSEDIKPGEGLYIDMPDMDNLDKTDWSEMINQLDAFFEGWERANKKKENLDNKKKKKKSKDVGAKEVKSEDEDDYIPTKHDEFEQYYLEREYKKAILESETMDEMLHQLGIELPPEELN